MATPIQETKKSGPAWHVVVMRCVIFLVFCVGVYLIVSQRAKIKDQQAMLSWYHRNYQHKIGGTSFIPNADSYRLFSYDGGKNWYALGDEDEIIGTAEEVFPGLLNHLDGWDRLEEYARKNGPINACGITGEETRLLQDANLTVDSGK